MAVSTIREAGRPSLEALEPRLLLDAGPLGPDEPAAADIYEPDNTPAQATNILLDSPPQLHTIHTASDVDWVRFFVSQTSDVKIETAGLEGDTEMWLYGPNSWTEERAYNDDGDLNLFSTIVETLTPGQYYVKVTSWDMSEVIEQYTLVVERHVVEQDMYEPDDTPAQAKGIATTGFPQTRSLHVAEDVDWLTFSLDRACQVTIETGGELGGDTEMWLYGPDDPAREIAYNDDGPTGGWSRLVETLMPGKYYVKVASYEQLQPVDEYTIAVSKALVPSFVELVRPYHGQFVTRGQPLLVEWQDWDPDYAAEIALFLDTDDDPDNGQGEQLLGTWAEDLDGPDDAALVALPAVDLYPATYYVYARMTNPQQTYYSSVHPIQAFERAFVKEDPANDAIGGDEYEVYGVEAGLIGETVYYRVRTNYDPSFGGDPEWGGADVHLTVGGTYQDLTGSEAGIAVNSHSCSTGQSVHAGDLYGPAQFLAGTIVPEIPTFVDGYVEHVNGQSSAEFESVSGLPWLYEVRGHFDRSAVPGFTGQPIQVTWTMYCGNDIAEVFVNDITGAVRDLVPPWVREFGPKFEPSAHRLVVRFNEYVGLSLAHDDLLLIDGVTQEAIDPADTEMTYDPQTHTATWTFPGLPGESLPYGHVFYAAFQSYDVTDLEANWLDGNADGLAGDDYENLFMTAIPGDANLDGEVSLADYETGRDHFGNTEGMSWEHGDFDFDGDVDYLDYLTVKAYYGQPLTAGGAEVLAARTAAAGPLPALAGDGAGASDGLSDAAGPAIADPAAAHASLAGLGDPPVTGQALGAASGLIDAVPVAHIGMGALDGRAATSRPQAEPVVLDYAPLEGGAVEGASPDAGGDLLDVLSAAALVPLAL